MWYREFSEDFPKEGISKPQIEGEGHFLGQECVREGQWQNHKFFRQRDQQKEWTGHGFPKDKRKRKERNLEYTQQQKYLK